MIELNIIIVQNLGANKLISKMTVNSFSFILFLYSFGSGILIKRLSVVEIGHFYLILKLYNVTILWKEQF